MGELQGRSSAHRRLVIDGAGALTDRTALPNLSDFCAGAGRFLTSQVRCLQRPAALAPPQPGPEVCVPAPRQGAVRLHLAPMAAGLQCVS